MADVSKVEYGGRTLVDLTNDTVTPETLAKGATAHDASGNKITGTLKANIKTYEITLAKASGWVLLTTLDSEVLEHINDESLVVTLLSIGTYEHLSYAVNMAMTTNTQHGAQGNYPAYGVSVRQTNATAAVGQQIFYPANKTDTSTSLGNAAFRVTSGKYYFRPSDGYVRACTYRLTFTW